MTRINLMDPALYAQEDGGLGELSALHSDRLPYWHPSGQGGGFWSVVVYDQAIQVLRNSRAFTSQQGINLGQSPTGGLAPAAGKMLVQSDAKVHRRLKAVFARYLGPHILNYVTDSLPDKAARLLDRAAETAGAFDFVSLVSRPLALGTLITLLGVPEHDQADLRFWADGAFDSSATDPDALEARSESNALLFAYLFEALRQPQRLTDPGLLWAWHRDRHQWGLTDEEIVLNAHLVLAGAYESTRHALTALGAYHAGTLGENGRQIHGSGPTSDGVEEVLRLASPALNIKRTATVDVALAGVTVKAGQSVTLWVPMLNRDPMQFQCPDILNLARTTNRHLSFGMGRHFCLGAFLARAELSALWQTLQGREIVIANPSRTRRIRSLRSWGYECLMVAQRGVTGAKNQAGSGQ